MSLLDSVIVKPATEKNLIDGVITITVGCELPDGSVVQALGKQSEVPIGIYCSEAFTNKLPITLIAFPGSFEDPRVRYKIAQWPNQSDLHKAKLFSRLVNVTSQGFLEAIDWGETDSTLLMDNHFRSQLEKTFKKSSPINEKSDILATEEYLVNDPNEIEDEQINNYERFQNLTNNEIQYQGQRFPSISALAKFLHINPQTLRSRIFKGWPEERWGDKLNG